MIRKMVLEASQLNRGQVVDVHGVRLGRIDRLIFTADPPALYAAQVATGTVVNRFRALTFSDAVALDRQRIVVESSQSLGNNLRECDTIAAETGAVIGVKAQTESGDTIGTLGDVLIDADTGLIVRLYVRHLWRERLIPVRYLVRITPAAIIFEDVVTAPTFAQIATSENRA